MPKPIQPSDIEQWSAWMLLSDAQAESFNRLYEEYVGSEEVAHRQFVQPLWDRSAAIREGAPNHLGVERALQLQQLILEERPKAVAKIIAVEERLFSAVEATLSDAQLERLHQVRMRRDRARCNRDYSRYPAGHIDLLEMLARLQAQGMACDALDGEAFERVCDEYDMLMGPLFAAATNAQIELVAKSSVLQAKIGDGLDVAGDLGVQKRRYRTRLVAAEKRIHDLNARMIYELAPLLPTPCASAMTQAFLEVAYPPVYPDPSDLSPWFAKALSIETLDDDRRKEIEALRALGETRREGIVRELKKEYLSYRQAFGIGLPGGSYKAYKATAEELHQRRVANARMIMASVTAVLSENERAQMEVQTLLAEERLEARFIADTARER